MTHTDVGWSPPPIADYGLLGDTRTAALVASDGSMDWLCLPRFDGDPVFARLIGGRDGGHFRLGPAGPARLVGRRYLGHTATLETTWQCPGGRLVLTEAMVGEPAGRLMPSTLIVRRLSAEGGPVDAALVFDPQFGEARTPPRTRRTGTVLVCHWLSLAVALDVAPAAAVEVARPVAIAVTPGCPVTVTLSVAFREPLIHTGADIAWSVVEADQRRWQEWSDGIASDLPEREAVVRSLLTLRLLTYSPSGAPVAAPTTSLPEHVGGARNWDYRYAWPRDASIGVGAFLGVDKVTEARAFLAWLLHASRLDRPRLPALLTLDGRRAPPERELEGWPGYCGSRPVRFGNGAANQYQLDGYGWVLDAAWLLTSSGNRIYSETWRAMAGFADEVTDRWREPDNGIWEVRHAPARHVHSKLMAWLALDRALRISDAHRTSARRRRHWRAERGAIATEVAELGFDRHRNAYTRTYGSDDLDAAVLVLPLLGLEDGASPRVKGTIDAVRRDLGAGGPLLYRYPPGTDGVNSTEGAFVPCSFWLAQALAASERGEEAQEVFADTVGLSTSLGLFAEEIDPGSGAHLGNFPQALSHAALVQAALALRGQAP